MDDSCPFLYVHVYFQCYDFFEACFNVFRTAGNHTPSTAILKCRPGPYKSLGCLVDVDYYESWQNRRDSLNRGGTLPHAFL